MTELYQETAVMYGAGNIGRGFIGQVFHDSGYEVVFVDINPDVISALNKRGRYTQRIVNGDVIEQREITNVRAIDGRDAETVTREISSCRVMAVSVGAAVLPRIALTLAVGLAKRDVPLNILVCENLMHAATTLHDYVAAQMSDPSSLSKIGFVGAAIGRMVPVIPMEDRERDPTLVAVEPFCSLPLDADAVVQPMPQLAYAVFSRPFSFQEEKKLYIHNMGHALTAYFGFQHGYTYIWQAIDDNEIKRTVRAAMIDTAEALARKYNDDAIALAAYVDDLLTRFSNRGLGDTVARVGADPMRKLASSDRLVGAVSLCKSQGISYEPILKGVAAALRFDVSGDISSARMHTEINERGIHTFLQDICQLAPNDAAYISKLLII